MGTLKFAAVTAALLIVAEPPALAQGAATASAPGAIRAGVDKWRTGDYAGAVAIWQPSAAAGDPDALFNMGQAYKLGRGVPLDANIARDYYRKAAVKGHLPAQANLGIALFQTGEKPEAIRWLKIAADRGEPRAQYVLGIAAFNGDGLPRSQSLGYAYLLRAQARGLPQATTALASIAPGLSSTDRAAGEAVAASLAAGTGVPSALAAASAPRAQPSPWAVVANVLKPPPVATPVGGPPPAAPIVRPPPVAVAQVDVPAQVVPRPAPLPARPAVAPAPQAPTRMAMQPAPMPARANPLPQAPVVATRAPDVAVAKPNVPAQAAAAPASQIQIASNAPPSAKATPPGNFTPSTPAADPLAPKSGQLAAKPAPVAKPSPAAKPVATVALKPFETIIPAKGVTKKVDGWRVQLGAFSQRKQADAAWAAAKADAGGGKPIFAADGPVVKLQLGPYATKDAAKTACAKLSDAGRSCFVTTG